MPLALGLAFDLGVKLLLFPPGGAADIAVVRGEMTRRFE
jgi:hypothetical protein